MTEPAVAETEAPASRVVRVPITAELLLRHLLCLDGELVGAVIEPASNGTVVNLYVDFPGAPERADELVPEYTRTACQGQAFCPGQTSLTGLSWSAGGVRFLPGADG